MDKLAVQILDIEKKYLLAKKAISEIGWKNQNIDYPQEVESLMYTIMSSDWGYNYGKIELDTIDAIIDRADIEQVKSALTAISMSEKWVSGYWNKILEENLLEKVIERAKFLTLS